MLISRLYWLMSATESTKSVPGAHLIVGESLSASQSLSTRTTFGDQQYTISSADLSPSILLFYANLCRKAVSIRSAGVDRQCSSAQLAPSWACVRTWQFSFGQNSADESRHNRSTVRLKEIFRTRNVTIFRWTHCNKEDFCRSNTPEVKSSQLNVEIDGYAHIPMAPPTSSRS